MQDDPTLITSSQAGALITQLTGRSCGPENVRRLARAGQLDVAEIVGNGQRLFDRGVVQRFAERRQRGDDAA